MTLWMDGDTYVEGGGPRHTKVFAQFYEKYDCGKIVEVMSTGDEGTLFAGRRIRQRADFSMELTMEGYVKEKGETHRGTERVHNQHA